MIRLPARVRLWAVSDGMLLVILGLGILPRGVSYLPLSTPPPAGHPVESVMPTTWWAAVWIAVGLGCMLASTRPDGWPGKIMMPVGVGLHALWGASFVMATLSGDLIRGWVTSAGYFSVTLLAVWAVWRGHLTGGEADA